MPWLVRLLAACSCSEPGPSDRPASDAPPATETGQRSGTTAQTGLGTQPSWRTLDAGANASCGVLDDGRLLCWGHDDLVTTTPAGSFVDVSVAADDIACALDADTTVTCWCMEPWSPYACGEAPSGTGFVRVESGNYWACAEDEDAELHCWGKPRLTRGAPSGPVLGWSIELNLGCAVLPDQRVECWGATELFGQGGPEATLEPPPGLEYVDVAVGRSHACALDEDGEAHCWGSTGLFEPYPEAPPGPFASIVAWNQFTCGIRPDGEAECWFDFPLFDDVDPDQPGKQRWGPPPGKRWARIGLGEWDACGLTLDGEASCWAPGTDSSGEVLELPSLDDL